MKFDPTPQPVQYDANGNIVIPRPSSSTAPATAAPVTGANIRAVGDQSANAAEYANNLGLTGYGGSSGTTVDPKDPPVLWTPGRKPVTDGPSYSTDPIEQTKTLTDAENEIFRSDSYREKVVGQMIAAGLLDPTEAHDLGAIQAAWKGVVGQAASFYAAGNGRTPEQVIALINVQKKAAAGRSNVPTTVTNDSTTPQHFTDAPSQIRAVLKQTLGRAPTEHEMQSYQAGLNAAAQADPQKTHQVVNTDANGNTTVNTTNTGGVDPTEVLGQIATADPEYGAYQASTTYMDALRQAIGAFVG